MGDFHKAFEAIDEDNSGEITVDELRHYMVKNNYKENFVAKWLSLFDTDHCGKITYGHFCDVLGLTPKEKKEEEMVVEEQKQESSSAAQLAPDDKKLHEPKPAEEIIEMVHESKESSSAAQLPPDDKELYEPKPAEEIIEMVHESKESTSVMEIPQETTNASINKKDKRQKHKYEEESIKPVKQTKQSTSPMETSQKSKAQPTKQKEKEKEKPKPTPVSTTQNQNQNQTVSLKKKNNTNTQKHKRLSKPFSEQTKKIRLNLQPGTCAIILAGKHKGKRVVIVERLESVGLLLISGPFKLNGCPLRRIHPDHVIGTQTKIDLGDNFEIPIRIFDKGYFTREKDTKRQLIWEERKKNELVSSSKIKEIKRTSQQAVSEERKADQKQIDRQIIARIKARGTDAKMIARYLGTPFSLSHSDYPHKMVF